VVDLAQWLRLVLGEGTYEGKQLISPVAVSQMHEPQIMLAKDDDEVAAMVALGVDSNFFTYALGWIVIDYRGKKVAFHPGGIDGYTAMVALLPQEKLGFGIVINRGESVGMPFVNMLMFTIMDAYIGEPRRDWNAEIFQAGQMMAQQGAAAWQKVVEARVKGTSPSLPLAQYAGTYREGFCGELELRVEGEKLVIHYGPTSKADLEHWHFDTFRANWRHPMIGPAFVTFTLDKTGAAEKMNIEGMGEFKREA
jgi:hypothetical protein